MKKQRCAGQGKPIGFVLVSKYAIKKYGIEDAGNRAVEKKVKKLENEEKKLAKELRIYREIQYHPHQFKRVVSTPKTTKKLFN